MFSARHVLLLAALLAGALAAPTTVAMAASYASCHFSLERTADSYSGISNCVGSLGGASVMPVAGGALLRMGDLREPCLTGGTPGSLELSSPRTLDVFQTDTVETAGRLHLLRAGGVVTVRGVGRSEGDAVSFTGSGIWRGGGVGPTASSSTSRSCRAPDRHPPARQTATERSRPHRRRGSPSARCA